MSREMGVSELENGQLLAWDKMHFKMGNTARELDGYCVAIRRVVKMDNYTASRSSKESLVLWSRAYFQQME